ncbi:MAG: PEGA domain-containing protein, partial [Acidobacteria bacterium]|nr:PEGA domain-containing protein [Acidobacteriota bacterium]
RLEQYEAGLTRELNEVRLREERGRDRATLGEERMVLEQNPDRGKVRGVLERSYAIRAKHPDDPEIGQAVAAIELTVKRVANVDDLSELLRIEPAFTGTDGGAGAAPARAADPKLKPKLVDIGEKTRLFPVPERVTKDKSDSDKDEKGKNKDKGKGKDKGPGLRVQVLEAIQIAAMRAAGEWRKPRVRLITAALVTVGLILAVLARFFPAIVDRIESRHPAAQGEPPIAQRALYPITIVPADSTVTIDGKVISDQKAEPGKVIVVSHPGYKPREVEMRQASDGNIVLEPEPLRLSVETEAKSGSVSLDGQTVSSDASLDDQALAPDDRMHRLTVPVAGGKSLEIEFKASTGARPQLRSFDANGVFVITSLGSQATIYGAAKTVHLGDQAIAVNPAGTDFTFSDQNNVLKFDRGSVMLEASNSPTLSVHSLTTTGQLVITSNVPSAKLTMDGLAVARRGKRWVLRNLTGSHNFTLSADNYEPKTWKLAVEPGQTIRKSFELAAIEHQLAASLLILGGTPFAEVELDGAHVGMLDASGAFRLPNSLALGKHHSLALKKDFCDPRVFDINPGGSEVRLTSVALTHWPTVSFDVEPANATVELRREGAAEFERADPMGVSLQPGKYEMKVEAAGYGEAAREITIGRENTAISIKLPPLPRFELENPDSVSIENGWYRAKNPSQFVAFHVAGLPRHLLFYRPGRVLLWDKKVEWLIETPEKTGHIQYTLEGHKLTRKLVVANKSSYQRQVYDVNAESARDKEAFSLHINAYRTGVTITNDQGKVLDMFYPQGYDFSNARIAVRTDSLFIVRSNP